MSLFINDSPGLKSEVLTIQWPTGVQPAQLPDFESQARCLRYQALGKACFANSIFSLLIAHHEDDQAETALMRLAKGLVGTPLSGMQASARIPECWGMYGVHESGNRGSPSVIQEVQNARPGNFQSTRVANFLRNGMETESGGIRILRPLLGFSKSRLQATCEHFGTQWAEDLTNCDPTITMRNSVRRLLHDQRLPIALRKKSLLCLAQRAQQRSAVRSHSMVQFFKQHCEILNFDLRSGSLVVQLNENHLKSISHLLLKDQGESIKEEQYRKRLLVHYIVKLITPLEDVSLQDLGTAVSMLFPESPDTGTPLSKANCSVKSATTVGKVWLRRVSRAPHAPKMQPQSTKTPNGNCPDCCSIWMLSRQPYNVREIMPTTVFRPARSYNSNQQIMSGVATKHTKQPRDWSSWQLWDGRYWIRLANDTTQEVEVRPMQEKDLATFRERLPSEQQASLNKKLRDIAPGRVRLSMPVIALKGEPAIAIPTLQEVIGDMALGVNWEIRYKKIDLTLSS